MAESNDLGLPSLQKLQSAEQMELLDVVDSLRACGLSDIVALPQLIVCGDQSSGKSSVLEAISGIPFPKQDTLCTRFATEVILRRAAKVEINVAIVPGDDRALIDRDRLLRFRRELKTKDDFGELFKVARDEMGLSSSGKSFSNDILRVEFCGPSQPQLTLVDLPGLIHAETNTQTTGDVQLVHNLVSRYLENPRSIILAVVSAKNDIGNQIILRHARNVDPQGLRTLGIITKPDLLEKGSRSEESFVTLARNEDVKFSLGWHVVRNLDSAKRQNQEQPEQETRDEQETLFFQQSSFNRLPAHTTGVTFLRSRLSKILFGQIRRELPRLVEDIQTQITAERIARDKLGPSRSQPAEQREFLISLSQTFQVICRDAVKGDYDHEFFQGDTNPERRLCANVMNMHFDFATNVRKNGASWLIDDEDMLSEKYRSRNDAIKEACILLKRSRGRELPGLPNPLLVGELFRQYSHPWGDLARLHIKKVWEATNRFLELLLRHLTDEDVCENIFRFWLHPIMEEKLKLAYSKLDELLEVHKDYPMTTNSAFINHSKTTRQDSRNENLESQLRSRLQSRQDVSVDEITQMMLPITIKPDLDMDMVAAEEALDNMNAYYEIAMNLFTDNVPTLAVQAPIIRAIPETFCPTAVYSMPAGVVHHIAGETEEKIIERDAVLRRLGTLEKGALICKQYAKRPQQVLNVSSELPVPSPRTSGDEGRSTPRKSPSAPKFFPDSVPKAETTPNIFGHLLVPSQASTGSRSEAPSPSPEPNSTRQKPPVFKWGAPNPTNSGTVSTEHNNGLFGISAETKPIYSGLFMSRPDAAARGSPVSIPAAKPVPAFGFPSSNASNGSIFGNTTPAPSLFGIAPTSNAGPGSISGARTSNASTGGFGGSTGMAPAKNDNPLKFPTDTNTTTTMTVSPPPSRWGTFKPFLVPQIGSRNGMMDCLQHISSMGPFLNFSCEEIRLRDYTSDVILSEGAGSRK
ncbi:hypothetical protein IFR05_005314 [Cadophora sp. M221]|nr:hypothetical protein IFR05_005314 [Cadophora sp. M221]